MHLTQQVDLQGYFISGMFTIFGAAIGSVITLISQIYLRRGQRKDKREAEARESRKAIYLEMSQILCSICETFIQLEEGGCISDVKRPQVLKKLNKYIEETYPKALIYANPETWSHFRECQNLTQNCIAIILSENSITDAKLVEYQKLQNQFQSEMKTTIDLIRKDLL